MAQTLSSNRFGDQNAGFQIGQNYGSISAEIHPPPERVETPPLPGTTVLIPGDPDFVARGELVQRVHDKFAITGARVALAGLGGVGKTQIALEYARQLRQQSPDTWVLWIHASNADRFEQSVGYNVERLKLYGRKNPKADALHLLQGWLGDRQKGSWLVVLDNVDDTSFLLEQATAVAEGLHPRRRMDCFPVCEHGSILITSRSRIEAAKLVYDTNIVEIPPMNEKEAETLIATKLRGLENVQDRLRLAAALDCMPLAMAQAAAYVRQRGSRCSIRQYIEKLEKSRRSRTSLLSRDDRFPSRDWEASSSILLTWQISFEHLHTIRKSAAELLALMSFCDRQAMPELLLRDLSEDEESIINDDGGDDEEPIINDDGGDDEEPIINDDGGDDEEPIINDDGGDDEESIINDDGEDDEEEQSIEEFDEDIVMLRSFAFVSETADTNQWEMHRLVQDATRMWLERSGQLARVEKKFVHHLYRIFPDGDFEALRESQALIPHAKAAAEKRPQDREALLEWASVMFHAAFYAHLQKKSTDAIMFAKGSMEARVQELGNDNSYTLESMQMVGYLLRDVERWKEAEELEVLVLETCKRVFGAEHPDTLDSMGELAATYRKQERWGEAEELEVVVMETSKRVLGAEHPDTLVYMGHLAATYEGQERWREAEELNVAAMETHKRVLGAEHPDTLVSISNLAAMYRKQERWREAEELQSTVAEAYKRVLGAEHPYTLLSIGTLATIYQDQGRWREAEEHNATAVETCKRALGAEHPDTLVSIGNLAATYHGQERWREAEELQSKVTEAYERVLGAEHPDTLMSMQSLAATYMKQGRWREAKELLVKVVETSKRVLGAEHPVTLTSAYGLAVTYWE